MLTLCYSLSVGRVQVRARWVRVGPLLEVVAWSLGTGEGEMVVVADRKLGTDTDTDSDDR